MEVRKIKISPEVLKGDLFAKTYDGFNFNVYSALTQVITGGTNGNSLLTDLSVPIILYQDYHEIGHYDAFDGDISQFTNSINFIFSSQTPYQIYFYLSTDNRLRYFENTEYLIDWGDNTPKESISVYTPEYVTHSYVSPSAYTISLSGKNSIGSFTVVKQVKIPYNDVEITNPFGTVYFQNLNGSWEDTPESYNFLFTGDSNNNISEQTGSTIINVPFVVSGYTQSQYSELESYGNVKYKQPGVIVNLVGGSTGKTISKTFNNTTYEIDGVTYVDTIIGSTITTTTFSVQSYGLTESSIVQSAITKNEVMLNIVEPPVKQFQGEIDRGKNSGIESFRRIGEVDSVGDVLRYGYGYFNVVNLDK
jgi:hypothetical protein